MFSTPTVAHFSRFEDDFRSLFLFPSPPFSLFRFLFLSKNVQTVRFDHGEELIRSPTLQKLREYAEQRDKTRSRVIYENGDRRRVGVGAIVATRHSEGSQRKMLAISNLTNNSAIGDSINGTAVPTEAEAFFAVFLTWLPFHEVVQLSRKHKIITLPT